MVQITGGHDFPTLVALLRALGGVLGTKTQGERS
jgi:hypothetical protein